MENVLGTLFCKSLNYAIEYKIRCIIIITGHLYKIYKNTISGQL